MTSLFAPCQVFLTFLVGNDFLPHLPSLDISEGAFDKLFDLYKVHLFDAARGGSADAPAYLTEEGAIASPPLFQLFLADVGALEDGIFKGVWARNVQLYGLRRRPHLCACSRCLNALGFLCADSEFAKTAT
jgi:5'-3' exonuclease